MALELEEFLRHPTEKELEKMSKKLLEIAARFDIELTAKEKRLKEGVGLIVKSGLADLGVFTTKPEKPAVSEVNLKNKLILKKVFLPLTYEQQKELMHL